MKKRRRSLRFLFWVVDETTEPFGTALRRSRLRESPRVSLFEEVKVFVEDEDPVAGVAGRFS
jgi:hypothetical protein